MGNKNDSDGADALFAVFAGLGFFTFMIFLFVWGLLGTIAYFVAPYDRRWTFFWLTFVDRHSG
jgi:hypothetical protein